MPLDNINWDDVPEDVQIVPGEHLVRVMEVDDSKPSNKGHEMWKLKLVVIGDKDPCKDMSANDFLIFDPTTRTLLSKCKLVALRLGYTGAIKDMKPSDLLHCAAYVTFEKGDRGFAQPTFDGYRKAEGVERGLGPGEIPFV